MKIYKKYLAIGIIILFFGAGTIPSICGYNENTRIMSERKFIVGEVLCGDSPDEQWNITFDYGGDEKGEWVEQTSDGGYIVAGRGRDGAWMIKTDSSGIEEWNVTFGGGDGWVECVQQTFDDGYILGGSKLSDFWLIKTDVNGTIEWQNSYDGGNLEIMGQVIQTEDGGYVMVGTSSWSNTGDIYFVKAYDNGTKEWDVLLGGGGVEYGYSAYQTSEGGYIITGLTGTYTYGAEDVWLIKTFSDGVIDWHNHFGGPENDFGHSVIQISDGCYIIGGGTKSYGAGSGDAWLIKTDSNGNHLWNKTYGNVDDGWCHTVVQTYDGGYILSGSCNHIAYETGNVWLVKASSNGTEEWDKLFGGTLQDLGRVVRQTSDYGYIVIAETKSFGNVDTDFWLIKIEPENQPPTAPEINGSSSGKPNIEYDFTFNTTDPDDDPVMYVIDWGDNNTQWTEYGDSGEEIILTHNWSEKGTYTIKAKAIDIHGAESDWVEFPITIPRNKAIQTSPFLNFLTSHPNMFPILQRLLQQLELY